ncbi:hypothetical protein EXIGLDRAFT_207504 [Exidia glandulosa HHB12029]|uniref:Uncharacterized protein n=1 Tax=Exidia glandulosa HHB12029 TaxID=1314781 RepID=A0A165ELS6_EXIGL|nr:hypothetical protein EXIGLDRAFT_207504 [Exidia glandulosa HHB12029]
MLRTCNRTSSATSRPAICCADDVYARWLRPAYGYCGPPSRNCLSGCCRRQTRPGRKIAGTALTASSKPLPFTRSVTITFALADGPSAVNRGPRSCRRSANRGASRWTLQGRVTTARTPVLRLQMRTRQRPLRYPRQPHLRAGDTASSSARQLRRRLHTCSPFQTFPSASPVRICAYPLPRHTKA